MIYNLEIINNKIELLKKISSVDRIYYAMKANNNLDVLKTINECNFGYECVSIDEVKYFFYPLRG